MTSTWRDGGHELIVAFRELARRGRMTLETVFTGHMAGPAANRPAMLEATAPDAAWHSLMPMNGQDNFAATLALCESRGKFRGARLVVCYSDGKLSAPVNAAGYRARGVDLVGTCIDGSPEAVAALERQFGRAVTGESAEVLASRLAQMLASRRR